MGQSIKISDTERDIVRREAEISSRSIASQVAHWMRIGRAIERSPQLTYAHIRDALEGRRSPDALSGEEQDVFVDAIMEAASKPTAEQDAFFEARRIAGHGVGADETTKIIKQVRKRKA